MPDFFELGMPRSHCFQWDHVTQVVYMGSALALTVAYVAIGYGLWFGYKRIRNKPPALRVAVPFGLFIALCGLGHSIEDIMAFWLPAYRLFAVWKLLTALVSVYAAFELPGALFSMLLEHDSQRETN